MMDIQTAEGVLIDVTNTEGDDFISYRSTITAKVKCCCDNVFSYAATIPDRLVETDIELTGQITKALVDLVIESRAEHLKERCNGR